MNSRICHAGRGGTPKFASTILFFALAATILLSGCGGGGGADTKTGSGGTGDPNPPFDVLTASGPLSSIGVAGIAATSLDDRASAIFINTQGGQPFGALKLGMVAEVAGTIPTATPGNLSGTATSIIVQSSVVGLVSAVDLPNQRVNLLSHTVQIDQNTIFEGFNSLASLGVGSRIEVYGLPQPEGNSLLATRLISLPANATAPAELLGNATNVTAFQFNLRGIAVSTAAVSAVTTPAGILPGTTSIVENTRVRALGTFSPGGNSISATQLVAGIPIVRNDNSIIVLDGVVQSLGANGRFRLAETDVETTAANAATVTVGSRVQVKGRKTAGVLMATDFRRIAPTERIQFVVQGDVTNFVSLGNFTVRGESINATAASFVGGTSANLANGRTVRIRAQAVAGHLEAIEVSFVSG